MPEMPHAYAQLEELRDMNKVVRRVEAGADTVTAASQFAVWILLPVSLGGLAYIAVGVWLLMAPYDPNLSPDWRLLLLLTLVLQGIYWAFVSRAAGRNPVNGLWGLLPVIALIPTFFIARTALLRTPPTRHM